MGIFDFLKAPDINQGLCRYAEAAGALLLDVRTPEEYRQGHIPGSKNLPLDTIGPGAAIPGAKDTPLFVYCHSGARSRQAAALLARMGYQSVQNIGGIAGYAGKVER